MWSPRTHIATLVLGLSLVGSASVVAQPDELTVEFGKLSAKERARIAKEEEVNAANDLVFQALMASAEEHFRKADFDEALSRYQEARVLRPYNVYPKVKIQDLQALIEARAKESPPAATPQEPITTLPQAPTTPVAAEPITVTVERTTPPPRLRRRPSPQLRDQGRSPHRCTTIPRSPGRRCCGIPDR